MVILKIKKLISQKLLVLKKTGFFSIFISNVFAKVVAFLGNIAIIRILSKNDYGIYAYAINAMTMLYLFNDFGASTSALQSLTENHNDKEKQKIILRYAMKVGLTGSLFSGFLILLSPLFYPFKIIDAKYYTFILCLIPLFSNLNAFISVVLRSNLENKKFAIFNFSQTFLNYIFLILMSIAFGLKGAIISQYCYIILTFIIGIFLSKNVLGTLKIKKELNKCEKKEFLKYSFSTQANSTLSSILLNIDLFLIGFMIGDAEVIATYKVASTIPMALSFLPHCVMIYILPYFVMHNKNYSWIKKSYTKLLKFGIVAYGIVTLSLCLLAGPLFKLFYGNNYSNAIVTFVILMIGFFFSSTIKIPTNNILYSMRKLKINLVVTISSTILNLIFNIIFIKFMGINGAAITTMSINIFSSILLFCYTQKTLLVEIKSEIK